MTPKLGVAGHPSRVRKALQEQCGTLGFHIGSAHTLIPATPRLDLGTLGFRIERISPFPRVKCDPSSSNLFSEIVIANLFVRRLSV